jgi:hypothetical protein
MLTATFLAPFLVPMFFFVITEKLFKQKATSPSAAPEIAWSTSIDGAVGS